MKKYTIFLSFIVASLGFIGCSEDFTESLGKGASKGDQIKFAAFIEDNTTRTSYGELTNGAYPIYWENDDKVLVWSPQATNDPNNLESTTTAKATYTVKSVGDNVSKYSLKDATEENALYWGNGDGENGTHDFYTFYPANANNYTTNGTFVFAVPREQDAVVSKVGDDAAGYTYTAVDMNAAIMAGHISKDRTAYTPNTEIVLPFKPLTTAFDIEILPPGDTDPGTTGEVNEVWITSVTIANKADLTSGRKILAGGFTYDAKTDTFGHYTNTQTSDDAGSYIVNIMLSEPVCLRRGKNDKLTVTGFMLPEIKSSSTDESGATLRVIVNCRKNTTSGEMKVYSKDVEWTATNKTNIEKHKCKVPLGLLPNPIVFSYETWMANLPEDTYISQISMPGTHDAGTYQQAGNFWEAIESSFGGTQALPIANQFDAGVRVLDLRPAYKDEVFNIAHGLINFDAIGFDSVLEQAISWLAAHPTEFIIIQLKNESSGRDGFLGIAGTENFVLWQQKIRAILENAGSEGNYNIKEFDPTMTLKEARGKFIFMSRDDYYSDSTNSAFGNWVGCKISGFPDNNEDTSQNTNGYNDNTANQLKPWYRSINTMFNNTSNNVYGTSHATIYVSDLYERPSSDNKKTAIVNSLSNTANKTGTKDIWCMTWLNRTGIAVPDQTGVYNGYAAEYIMGTTAYNSAFNLTGSNAAANEFAGMSNATYQNAGIVMIDWAWNKLDQDQYNGYKLIKAVVDNNFKGGGPAQKPKTN